MSIVKILIIIGAIMLAINITLTVLKVIDVIKTEKMKKEMEIREERLKHLEEIANRKIETKKILSKRIKPKENEKNGK